jgi:hypothetical protein
MDNSCVLWSASSTPVRRRITVLPFSPLAIAVETGRANSEPLSVDRDMPQFGVGSSWNGAPQEDR